MLSYPYIEELFKNIFGQSTVIQGRFSLCPHWGTEINANNLEEVVKRSTNEEKPKAPLVIMMPPDIVPDYQSGNRQRDYYSLDLLFLTISYASGNGMVKQPGGDGRTTHTIQQDWHDMKRCADDFIRILDSLVMDTDLKRYFTRSQQEKPLISPVSTIGNDRMSGVRLQFKAIVFSSACVLEDYPADYLTKIAIPTTDSHPSHLH